MTWVVARGSAMFRVLWLRSSPLSVCPPSPTHLSGQELGCSKAVTKSDAGRGAEQDGEQFMEKAELVPGMCKQQWAQDRREGIRVRSTAWPPAPLSQGSEWGQRLEGKGKQAAAAGCWAALPPVEIGDEKLQVKCHCGDCQPWAAGHESPRRGWQRQRLEPTGGPAVGAGLKRLPEGLFS